MASRARFPLAALLAALLCLAAPAAATAALHLPPAGKVFHGVASGDSIADFQSRTGSHPAVWQQFILWGGSVEYTFDRARSANARLMLHLSTAPGQNLPGRISPGEIARGQGDRWLAGFGRRLAEHGEPVYLRVMGEMNNCDLAYASHGCNGRPRGADHTAGVFKQAWRRIHAIVSGGPVAGVDARLKALGLRPFQGGADTLARPQVSFVWSPMTGGSPMIGALEPGRFWPGARYVDWVGTSFYSRFPNFKWLTPYYQRFAARHGKPFVLAEYAIWGGDHASFARSLFAWVKRHPKTRMMVYNQGNLTDGPFRLRRFPGAAQVIRGALSSPRFAQHAPEHAR